MRPRRCVQDSAKISRGALVRRNLCCTLSSVTVPFWAQITQKLIGLSPKRDCHTKRVNTVAQRYDTPRPPCPHPRRHRCRSQKRRLLVRTPESTIPSHHHAMLIQSRKPLLHPLRLLPLILPATAVAVAVQVAVGYRIDFFDIYEVSNIRYIVPNACYPPYPAVSRVFYADIERKLRCALGIKHRSRID